MIKEKQRNLSALIVASDGNPPVTSGSLAKHVEKSV